MSTDPTAYPNLGFNPVPGMPEQVEATGDRIAAAVRALGEAGRLVNLLRDAEQSIWQGDAAGAFRENVNDKLLNNMTRAHISLEDAVGVLRGWHIDLIGFRASAAELDREAGEARQWQASAETELQRAQANPDLQLIWKWFHDEDAMRQARQRIDAAAEVLRAAESTAGEARRATADILRQAEELRARHEEVAGRAADRLKHATDWLAPHKPGGWGHALHSFTNALGSVTGWVGDHLDEIHSALSTISAVAGFVALLPIPPVDGIALGISVAAGAGALACDVANPEFRHGVGEMLHGHFTSESIGVAITGAVDVISVAPGVGAAARSLREGEAAAEGATTFARVVDCAAKLGVGPSRSAKVISALPGVSRTLETIGLIEKGADPRPVVDVIWKAKTAGWDVYKQVRDAT